MMWREPWRTRLLFVSIALNLLLLPPAAWHLLPRRPPLTPGLPPAEMVIGHMARDLDATDAARLREGMEPHAGEIDAARARMAAARGAMTRAIRHNPFDPAALQAAMTEWQARWQQWSEELGAAMLDAFPRLSQSGREALAAGGQRRPLP